MPEQLLSVNIESEDQYELLGVLMRAFKIYQERDAIRGDLWRSRPPSHKLEMMREKTDRAELALGKIEEGEQPSVSAGRWHPLADVPIDVFIDSMLDSINFAAFAILEVTEGQRG